MQWPLPTTPNLLIPPHPGSFGAIRRYDVHAGIDLYCEEGTPVRAVEPGTVVQVQVYTGEKAGSPWWLETHAVMVEGSSGVICYGEISTTLSIGDQLNVGDHIGYVQRVLRHDKGKPMSMLHFELYKPGSQDTVWWYLNDPQPVSLLDPTPLLKGIMENDNE